MPQQAPIQVMAFFTPLRVAQTLVDPELRGTMAQELRARAQREGKWAKAQAFYIPVSLIPPAAWRYECSTCTFFSQKSCELVKDVIQPYAWCALWVNRGEDNPLSWIGRAFV